ncbi:MAG: hypothetical protein ACRYGR_06690 [Janthinobacterium lividum]
MRPDRLLRIRLSASMRHRPFWLSIFVSLELICWGVYVALMTTPLARLPSFDVLHQLRNANAHMSHTAIVAGVLLLIATVLNFKTVRMIVDIIAVYAWVTVAIISDSGMQEHPGVVLYIAPVCALGFDFSYLIYDAVKKR